MLESTGIQPIYFDGVRPLQSSKLDPILGRITHVSFELDTSLSVVFLSGCCFWCLVLDGMRLPPSRQRFLTQSGPDEDRARERFELRTSRACVCFSTRELSVPCSVSSLSHLSFSYCVHARHLTLGTLDHPTDLGGRSGVDLALALAAANVESAVGWVSLDDGGVWWQRGEVDR